MIAPVEMEDEPFPVVLIAPGGADELLERGSIVTRLPTAEEKVGSDMEKFERS